MNKNTITLITYGILSLFFYFVFDWSATSLEILDAERINMDDELAKRSFYVFTSIFSFILLIYSESLLVFNSAKSLKIFFVKNNNKKAAKD